MKHKAEMDGQEQRARQAAQDLIRAVNEIGFDTASFAEEICGEHRTLQQTVFRALGAVLCRMAADHDAGFYDLRNEHAGKTAVRIVKAFKDELQYVPHI